MTPTDLGPEGPLFIVLNAASGSGDADLAQAEMERALSAAKRAHQFLRIDGGKNVEAVAQRAAELAVRESGAVIAAGGDGTINAAVQAVLPTGRPLGIVPQGTFNYTTRAHGIPLDVKSAVEALLTARIEPVSVGLVNDRVFLVNASVGLYPRLLEEREAYKQRYGRYRLVAAWAGVMTLLREHRQLLLEIEHDQAREVVKTPSLFVGNNALQLQQAGLPEAEAVEQCQLAGVLLRPLGTRSLLWLALRGALGQLGGAAHVRDFAFRRMLVRPVQRATRPLKVATDGEVRWMKPPLVFSLASKSLMLMVPAPTPREPES